MAEIDLMVYENFARMPVPVRQVYLHQLYYGYKEICKAALNPNPSEDIEKARKKLTQLKDFLAKVITSE